MSKAGAVAKRWIRFPLPLLAYWPDDVAGTFDVILYHALWLVGGSERAQKLDEAEVIGVSEEGGCAFDMEDEIDLRILRGAMVLELSEVDCRYYSGKHEHVLCFLDRAGKAARNLVNMDFDNFWRARATAMAACPQRNPVPGRIEDHGAEGGELSWRDFRFLCAVLSKIGKNKFAQCGWREIQARAAGFCGKREIELAWGDAERKRRRLLLLTQDQIRASREKLERENWFVRVSGIPRREAGRAGSRGIPFRRRRRAGKGAWNWRAWWRSGRPGRRRRCARIGSRIQRRWRRCWPSGGPRVGSERGRFLAPGGVLEPVMHFLPRPRGRQHRRC